MKKVMLSLALGLVLVQAPAQASVMDSVRSAANTVKAGITRVVNNLVNAGKTVIVGNVNLAKDTVSALTK